MVLEKRRYFPNKTACRELDAAGGGEGVGGESWRAYSTYIAPRFSRWSLADGVFFTKHTEVHHTLAALLIV